MKIIRLESENVKRLHAVVISPTGAAVVIGGKNSQGKTSVLDSIEMALGGKRSVPKRPIHKGKESARVVCDLGEIVVTRTFAADGRTTLKVTTPEGAEHKGPQRMLDDLVGRLSFDPLEFSRQDAADQRVVLNELVGLDFSEQDYQRDQLYSERTGVNRTTKTLEGQLAGLTHHEDAPDAEVSVEALLAEVQAADESRRRVAGVAADVEFRAKEVVNIGIAIRDMEQELEDLLEAMKGQRELLAADKKAHEDAVKQMIDPHPIQERLVGLEESNRKARDNQRHDETNSELVASREQEANLTARIGAIDASKTAAISAAKFPIDGLSVSAEGVEFNGLPFDQASSAEQLRVSVAMGLAVNPKLRVLLIRDGSLLDEDSLKMVAEMASKADAQVWIERVGEDSATSVVIEDGAVRP